MFGSFFESSSLACAESVGSFSLVSSFFESSSLAFTESVAPILHLPCPTFSFSTCGAYKLRLFPHVKGRGRPRRSLPCFACSAASASPPKPRSAPAGGRTGSSSTLPFNRLFLPPPTKMACSTNEALSYLRSAPVDDGTDGEVGTVPSNVTEIVVIRHGETTWNACGRIQGHLDSELNELGRRQAMALGERLSEGPMIAAIYSSDLKRAAETANFISQKCESLEVILDPGLKERHLGDLQGVVFRDASKIAPEAYEIFVSSRTDLEIPGGGESIDQFHDRCISALERIASSHLGQRIVVVTHGGVIREFFNRAAPRGSKRGKILNVSVNVLRISDKLEWSIKSWGDVSHLDGVGYLGNAFGGDRKSG